MPLFARMPSLLFHELGEDSCARGSHFKYLFNRKAHVRRIGVFSSLVDQRTRHLMRVALGRPVYCLIGCVVTGGSILSPCQVIRI